MHACKICQHDIAVAFTALVRNKHEAMFYVCPQCALIQTPDPRWLPEAYEHAVVDSDTGLAHRNFRVSRVASTLLYFLFPQGARFLDIAGGYGLFVRLMRDVGFDFYWSDKYCKNVLARGFEAKEGDKFDLATAFEVLEHVEDPVGFLRGALAASGSHSILLSTELYSGTPPDPRSWWYYAFESGQHISFYTRGTLREIAKRLDKRLYTQGSLHLFTDIRIPSFVFWLLTHRLASRLLFVFPLFAMRSKTMSDHSRIVASQRSAFNDP